jgi:hypothetical protein
MEAKKKHIFVLFLMSIFKFKAKKKKEIINIFDSFGLLVNKNKNKLNFDQLHN